MSDKQPMQADGQGTKANAPDDNGELASRREPRGESGGGAYPNPHTGKDGAEDGPDTFGGHGGQTQQAYHGGKQLGEEKLGDGENAQTE